MVAATGAPPPQGDGEVEAGTSRLPNASGQLLIWAWRGRVSLRSGKLPGSPADEGVKASERNADLHLLSCASEELAGSLLPPRPIYSGRSGSSPDKHIDFKIKCVPTAAAPRLEQTEMWR